MKRLSKKTIVGMLILILLIVIIIGIVIIKNSVQKESNMNNDNNYKTNYNINEGIVENKIVNDILFSNIECSFDGNRSLFTYKITNNSKETGVLNDYEIIVKDKDDNILANMVISVTEELEPNESIETGNSIDIDLRGAKKLELVSNSE